MTFDNAPWALDGARIPSRLARTASYIESGGVEGVIGQADLKVTPLAVPGVGVLVSAGAAILLNRYQTTPNQSYAVSNPGTHTVDAVDMPPANPSAQSHLVCVTIGDPEFSQSGHPWMTSTPIPDNEKETFQYVRVFVIPNVPAGTTSFKQLNQNYPAYALARIDVPANTSTITSSMIVDLRKLAKPRSQEVMLVNPAVGDNTLDTVRPSWEMFGGGWDVFVPEWATTAKLQAWVQGILNISDGSGEIAMAFFNLAYTPGVPINEPVPRTSSTDTNDRKAYTCAGEVAIPSNMRGATQHIEIVAHTMGAGSNGFLLTNASTSSVLRIRFEENVL